jgi:hypothetical protein
MLPELNVYCWQKAFEVAGAPCADGWRTFTTSISSLDAAAVTPFSQEDVCHIYILQQHCTKIGECTWYGLFGLRDGRLALVIATECSRGWHCTAHARAQACTATTLPALLAELKRRVPEAKNTDPLSLMSQVKGA